MIKATITYPCAGKEALRLKKSLGPEMDAHRSERAEVKISFRDGAMRFSIGSQDMGALRAAFNSVTKLLSVHKDMQDIK